MALDYRHGNMPCACISACICDFETLEKQTAHNGDAGNAANVIPTRIHSEEGTSRHYALDATWAFAHPELCAKLREAMRKTLEVKAFDTVTTDAVYRQTLNKEAYWRSLGCVGVDMEASALLQVCACYHVPAAAALLASDGHPLSESEGDWDWGSVDFAAVRRQYIHQIVEVSHGQAC